MAYSEDYRRRAVGLVKEGVKKLQVAQLFGIARTTLDRWLNSSSLPPKLAGPKKPWKLDPEALAAHVEAYPDAYQHERAVALNVSRHVVGYGLKRLEYRRKKNVSLPRKRRRTSQ